MLGAGLREPPEMSWKTHNCRTETIPRGWVGTQEDFAEWGRAGGLEGDYKALPQEKQEGSSNPTVMASVE